MKANKQNTQQVILIAGASGAIGGELSRLLRRKGFQLALQGRKKDKLESLAESLGSPTPFLCTNTLSSEPEADELITNVKNTFGRLDGLISTIGGIDPVWPRFSEASDQALLNMLESNLFSSLRLARAAKKLLKPGARIVFTASRGGLLPDAFGGAYSVAKAALIAAVKVLADDLKTEKIRVNAVAPATIRTQATMAAMPEADSSRWVSPEEVATALCFLASEESEGITGTILPVYGRT